MLLESSWKRIAFWFAWKSRLTHLLPFHWVSILMSHILHSSPVWGPYFSREFVAVYSVLSSLYSRSQQQQQHFLIKKECSSHLCDISCFFAPQTLFKTLENSLRLLISSSFPLLALSIVHFRLLLLLILISIFFSFALQETHFLWKKVHEGTLSYQPRPQSLSLLLRVIFSDFASYCLV